MISKYREPDEYSETVADRREPGTAKKARIHDFSVNRWGHAQYLTEKFQDEKGNAEYSGLTISTPVVREGDFIEWRTAYGILCLLVEKTEFVADPADMTRVAKAVVVERRDEAGNTLWERNDVQAPGGP